jgi:hypothetical protein
VNYLCRPLQNDASEKIECSLTEEYRSDVKALNAGLLRNAEKVH